MKYGKPEKQKLKKIYNEAFDKNLREIQDKEGPSNVRALGDSVGTAAGITMLIASRDKRK
jgi:hypothetical protein